MNLSNEIKITTVVEAAAALTDVVTGAIDMAGYDGVMIGVRVHVADPANYLKAQQDMSSGLGTASDITGSKVIVDAADEFVFVDIYKPTARYIQGVIKRGASTATGDIIIIQYAGSKKPEANVRTGYKGTLLVSPNSGTL